MEPIKPIARWSDASVGDTVRLDDGRCVLVGDVNELGGLCDDCMEQSNPVAVVTTRADFDALAAEAADARTLRAERDSLVKERDEAREALAEERASRYPCNGPGELWRPLAMDDGPPRLYIFQRKRIDESDTPPSYMEISEEDGTLLLHYVKHGEADDSIIVECGADLPLRKMAEAARGDLAAATARADKAEALLVRMRAATRHRDQNTCDVPHALSREIDAHLAAKGQTAPTPAAPMNPAPKATSADGCTEMKEP